MRVISSTLIILFVTVFLAENCVSSDTSNKWSSPRINNTPILVADLSKNLIAITTRFTGAEVLLFGSTNGIGDIIVIVRAPESQVVVRRKKRTGGIWINSDRVIFKNVPGFYYVAATQPIINLLPEETLKHEQIGAKYLSMEPLKSVSEYRISDFTDALIRNKEMVGLFNSEFNKVEFLNNRLFRTEVKLPSNVPTGVYLASVYLVSDGKIIERTDTTLHVRKTGFESNVFDFANQHPSLYGMVAILIALSAGWFAGIIFRNV
jgi:uncharacterized protein (TIGR02186 family)